MKNSISKLSIARIAKKYSQIIIVSVIIFFASIVYSFINWQKHVHFQTFAWDTAIFDQQVYLVSQLKNPYSSLHQSLYDSPEKIHALTDHFHPLVLLVGGILYQFWADPRILMIAQSIIVSLSGIPLFMISKKVLSQIPFSSFARISISFSLTGMYLFSVSTQAMVLDEFHDDSLVLLPLLFTLYFLLTNKTKWYWISFLFVLATKEEYGLLGIPIGFYSLLRGKIKQGILTGIIGLTVFFFLVSFLMPRLSNNKTYVHFREENKPTTVVKNLLNNPYLLVSRFFNHEKKQKTLFVSVASFAALPLFSGPALLLPLFALAIRFYDETTPRRYEFNNHYASPFIGLWAFAAIFGLYYISIYLIKKKRVHPQIVVFVITVCVVGTTVLQNIYFHGPVNSLFKKSFYETQAWEYDAHELIKHVPLHVSLASQNSLLPHLSQRENFYLLPEIKDAEFIAVDLHEGPNKFASYSAQQTSHFIDELVEKGTYQIIWGKNKAKLLEKI